MKAKHLPILCLCLAGMAAQAQVANFTIHTGRAYRQDSIDRKALTVQYDMLALTDPAKPDQPVRETMRLDIGRRTSRFYSYTAAVRDSVMKADMDNGASTETINQHARQYKSVWSEQTYKGYPQGHVTTLDEIAGDISRLRCEEEEEKPAWTLDTDTLTLLGYRCARATARFKGRQWTAWFAPGIPVSDGPWKLCGLPGLILKAEDAEGHYRFEANGIEQCRDEAPILFGGKDYERVSRKQYARVHERFATDPVGFITGSMPNVTITIKDEHGQPAKNPKDMPHNPIER